MISEDSPAYYQSQTSCELAHALGVTSGSMLRLIGRLRGELKLYGELRPTASSATQDVQSYQLNGKQVTLILMRAESSEARRARLGFIQHLRQT